MLHSAEIVTKEINLLRVGIKLNFSNPNTASIIVVHLCKIIIRNGLTEIVWTSIRCSIEHPPDAAAFWFVPIGKLHNHFNRVINQCMFDFWRYEQSATDLFWKKMCQ